MEDWSTIRFTCAQCSRGDLGPHECTQKEEKDKPKAFGFAATSETELYSLLYDWVYNNPGADHGQAEVLLSANKV